MKSDEQIATSIEATLQSINEHDSHGEAANVVDGLFAIARAIRYLADTIKAKEVNK